MSYKLGVCVPYRNRELHLNEFVPKVGKFLKDAGIDFQMYFAHQVDDKLFKAITVFFILIEGLHCGPFFN